MTSNTLPARGPAENRRGHSPQAERGAITGEHIGQSAAACEIRNRLFRESMTHNLPAKANNDTKRKLPSETRENENRTRDAPGNHTDICRGVHRPRRLQRPTAGCTVRGCRRHGGP